MSDLDLNVKATMEEVSIRLKALHPNLEFFFVMIPFHKMQMQHLSTEQRQELEKRVVRAANVAFERAIKNPDPMRREDLP